LCIAQITRAPSLNWISARERQLILFFSGQEIADTSVDASLSLGPESTTGQIQFVRVIVHVAVTALSVENSNVMSYFRMLMTDTQRIKGCALPCMPEDVLATLVAAVKGRWYKCPNGHPFVITECGRPTQVYFCDVCKLQIGGREHNDVKADAQYDIYAEKGTRTDQTLFKPTEAVDKSPIEYCLKLPAQESRVFDSARSLPPQSDRLMRFMTHVSLLLGCVSTSHLPPAQRNSTCFATGLRAGAGKAEQLPSWRS
jgi:hypothetical protein